MLCPGIRHAGASCAAILLSAACLASQALAQSGPPTAAAAALAARARAAAPANPAEAIRLGERALSQLPPAGDPRAELAARAALAEAHAAQGDSPAAREAAERWYALALRHGSATERAEATIHLGWFHTRVAEYDQALARFVEALGPDGLSGQPKLRALALHGIGRVHATREAPDQAVEPLEEARRIFGELGDDDSRAEVTGALGVTAGMRGDLKAAQTYFLEALAAFRRLGIPRKELVALANLAVVRDDSGDAAGALRDQRRALELARTLDSPRDVALAHVNIGELLLKLGRPAEAVPHLQESLRISHAQAARQMESWSHENLSTAYERLGQYRLALDHARQYRVLRDAMFGEESASRVAELETRYRTEARERENARLRAELDLQQAVQRRDHAVRLALAAGLAALALALVALAGRYFTTRRHHRELAERHTTISQQKAELEALRDALEARVAARTADLARTNADLRQEIAQRQEAEAEKERLQAHYLHAQKMEAVGLMAGGVAHDFNNILTGIGMSCELALQDVPADSPGSVALRDVLDLSQRAARLTRQLLAFSRKQLLRPEPVRLHDLIEHSLRMLSRIIGEDIQIRFRPGAAVDTVEADPSQMEQVLVNLAVNARDAMPRGGQLLLDTAVETLAAPLEVAAEDPLPAGDYIALRVTDTGTGMDEATLARIFEPFFTTKPATRGTGLGLSTVYGVVRQHGGTVRVASQPGVGTTFTVLLPVLPTPPTTAPADTPPERPAEPLPAASRIAVLLLEDDDSIRELLQRLLSRHGYEVFAARTPDDAAGLLETHGASIRLLVSDVVLTGSSGPDFYRDVVIPRFPHVRALFMSGYSDADVLEDAVVRHGYPFIAKPFTPVQIVEAVTAALVAP